MKPWRAGRRPAAVLALAVPAAALLLTGCGDTGGLESAGPTPTAVGPRELWPSLTPASAAVDDYGAGETDVVKGVAVPGGDLRRVDPVSILRAQQAADPDSYKDIAAGLADCGDPGTGEGKGKRGPDCPVLHAYFADLTGDGKDDMVVGVEAPKQQLVVRVYTYEGGTLTQIMNDEDAVISVELAGDTVVVRAVADLSGYEYRTSWSYDAHQKAMLPTRDEIVRTGPPQTPSAGTGSPEAPTEPPSETPSATPSARPSPSAS
ncbi:hypothetical protein [Streptomyces sp. NPDC057694]|uniref:hypothetical protein n=1 Tax=Streptomyces sp. NPDC057694 TaxID=3346216 RepID=UPI0036CE3A94